MSKQTFHLPTWRRKPTADEAAPDIADSELVPSESAARPTRRKHGKRTYVIGGALLALAIAAAIIIPGAAGVGDDDGAGGARITLTRPDDPSGQTAEDNIYITTGVMDRDLPLRDDRPGRRQRSASSTTTRPCITCASSRATASLPRPSARACSSSSASRSTSRTGDPQGRFHQRRHRHLSDQIVANPQQQDYEDALRQAQPAQPQQLRHRAATRCSTPPCTANDDGRLHLTFRPPSRRRERVLVRHQARIAAARRKAPNSRP